MASILAEIQGLPLPESAWVVVIPVLFGLLSRLTPWLPSEDQIDEQVRTAREVLVEKVATALTNILRAYTQNDPLRGDRQQGTPDAAADCATSTFFLVDGWWKLRRCATRASTCHHTIIITIVLAVVAAVVAVLWPGSRPVVGLVAIVLIAIQVAAILVCYHQYRKVKAYVSGL